MLASDIANKEYQGAVPNPDDLLYVEFYWHEPVNKWESEKIGKVVKGPRMPYVRMMRPGDQLTIQEVPVEDHHKARFPQKWLAWQIKEGLIEGEYKIPGWSIDEWNELNDAQRHELKYLRFTTVEQIAGASDTQIQRVGMGGLALREKARLAIRGRMSAEVQAEIRAKDEEIQQLQAANAATEERLRKLEEALLANAKSAEKPKRKYTRKAKPEVTA